MRIKGRVWKFGDNIDTDLMLPNVAFNKPIDEQARLVFKANRPGWAEQVEKGDIIVAGKNFGTGSSRPAAQVIKFLGIEAIIADSVNGLFFRNCINYGLPAFNVPGVSEYFQEGETAEVYPHAGAIKNMNTGKSLQTEAFPEILMKIIEAGGMLALLEKEGYLKPLQYEKEEEK
jgi:3-isopropylmalate/(R)-2-methylmalate dehydratase small subunit